MNENSINEKIRKEELRILDSMKEYELGSAGYKDLVNDLADLADIRRKDEEVMNKNFFENRRNVNEKKRDRINFGIKIFSTTAGIATFFLMLKQEQTGSLRSKGYDWFKDFMKKGDVRY